MSAVSDLAFFSLVVKQGSLARAAQELGVTSPAVSKRLAALELRLGVRLINRTTRKMNVTREGELYLEGSNYILEQIAELEQKVTSSRSTPTGLLRIDATLGFGRCHVAPALSAFTRLYPDVEVQLHLSDRPMNLVERGFDVGIRVGDLPDLRIVAVRIASNRRLLCAAPAYVRKFGTPATPRDLHQHNCIVIRQFDDIYGTWHLRRGNRTEMIKVHGTLSSNDGHSAVVWALNGHGILLRSDWEIAPYLRAGRLVQVLPEWQAPSADVYAVYPQRTHLPAKVRALVDFLSKHFQKHLGPARTNDGSW